MVFESVVAGVLNNVLGDFVDNLDPSQLNVGIWGGDVKLNDLELKESALDVSGLPMKLKFGRLNSLIMKIPWNKLYTEPVIVDIEGLYIIITPNRSIIYDEKKAQNAENAAKQKELNTLEENRRAKRKVKTDTEDPQQSSSFTEKLVAQIIKNLQVKIKNIHIRYEDKFSNHSRPFAFGITLESLEFQTTNTNFESAIMPKEEMKLFHKLVSLNNLAVYWNYQSKILSDSESKDLILEVLRSSIATKYAKPENYIYVFGPLSMNAKLILNQKPELTKFKVPKIDLKIETEEIGFAINKLHYQDMLYFLEALERFSISQPYLKFRPYLTVYRGHYKRWYKFCFDSVIHDIRRRHDMWRWENMKQHRKLVKEYREAWLHVRTEKTPLAAQKATVESIEKILDVFNLNLAREQAEMDIDRLNLVRVEDQEVETWGSWAKSWFGSSKSPTQAPEGEIVTQLQQAFTSDEKNKLYAAIDFQENLPSTNYPKEFVENQIAINVSKVSVMLDLKLILSFTYLSAELQQRPSARALHVRSSVKSVSLQGDNQQILQNEMADKNWLDAEFITNPLDNSFDYYVGFTALPVIIKYHAPAVNIFLNVFQQPNSVRIRNAVTSASIEAAKARSMTGLEYAVNKNARIKLKIFLSPAVLIFSKGGAFDENAATLAAKLGSLSVTTVDDLTNFTVAGDIAKQIRKDIMSKAYLKICTSISDIQLCFADNYNTCMNALRDENSPHHLIKPLRMDLNICSATVDDLQIPRYNVYCELPKVCVSISDERLTKLLEMLLTFPQPITVSEDDEDDKEEHTIAANESTLSKGEPRSSKSATTITVSSTDTSVETAPTQSTDVPDSQFCIYEFKIREISMLLFSDKFQKSDNMHGNSAFCALNFANIGFNGYMMKGGYMQFRLKLEALTMDDLRTDVHIRRLLDKKNATNTDSNPFTEMFYEMDKDGAKRLQLSSSSFYVLLNPEFLGALSCFVVMPKMEEADPGLHPELSTNRSKAPTVNKSFNSTGGGGVIKVANPEAPVSSLTMKCRIQQVEVILIEDSFKPDESQALILSLNAYLDAKNENNIQHFDGSIQDLQITSTYFNVSKREDFSYSVLRRVDIVLKGTIDEENKAQNFNVNIDKFHVKVSPSVIRLLSAVSTHFSEHHVSQETDDTDESGKRILRAYTTYWESQKIKKKDYWWFQNAIEDEQDAGTYRPIHDSGYSEKANFSIQSFMITVEAGVDKVTVPMILLDSNLNANARNWSKFLELDADMSLQMLYYNEAFCVWEPIIEPVQVKGSDERSNWKSWQITMQMRSRDNELVNMSELEEEEKSTQMPKMMVTIDAKEMMNVTITKSFLRLTANLAIAFDEAARQITPPKTRSLPGSGSYLVRNETGLDIEISNSDSLKVSCSNEKVNLPHCKFLDLECEKEDVSASADGLLLTEVDSRRSELRIHMLRTHREVNVMRAEKRCVSLPYEADSMKKWTMMVDTRLENSRHIVFLRSLVNFVNHTQHDIEVQALKSDSNRLSLCGIAKTDEEPLYIPLNLVYTPTGKFHLILDGHDSSNESISWHNFDSMSRFVVRCDSAVDKKHGTYIEAVVETENVSDETGKHIMHRLYTVHLYPPLFLRNYLPVPLIVNKPIEKTLEGGEGTALNLIHELTLEFSVLYNENMYSANLKIPKTRPDLSTHLLTADDDSTLLVGLNWSTKNRQIELNVFVRHWMVNNTNKVLSYTPTNIEHPVGKNPIFFPLGAKDFYDNKKAKVCIKEKTNYSNDFPLDTAGNAGRIVCHGEHSYEFSVDVQLCHFGLTKVITFSPFYLVQNESYFDIEICEKDSDKWLKIPQKSCVDLWPSQTAKRKLMRVRYKGQPEASIFFPFTETFESFCKINNPYLGVYVTCVVGESSSVIRIEPFVPGMVPAVVMNATPHRIRFHQSSNSESSDNAASEEVLESGHLKAFTWSDVTIQDRVFRWKSGSHKGQDRLLRNNAGTYVPTETDNHFHWVSFLNGRQRIFLFTEDEKVALTALQSYEMERINLQIDLNLYGIGMSLVNNYEGIEVLYMAMSSSGILWEQQSRSRYRPLAVKAMGECEAAHIKWKSNGSLPGFHPTENFEIDFINMKMRHKGKNSKSEVQIRRSFQNGLWVQLRQSAHQTRLHFKLNHLQIDNQLPACIFPCVLAVVPPPKSVVANNEPRPFMEFSFVMSQSEYSNVVEIKYLHILIQEFAIRVDNGLINAAIDLFSSEATPMQKVTFGRDLELISPQLSQRVIHTTATQLKSYYGDLHISPLMVHLSFSQGGSLDKKKEEENSGMKIHSEFLNVILKSFGVTLTELQDVVFKLAYFDRKYMFYNRQELQSEVMSHYTFQFIKQFYVLVLGLDIIGNPFGLVRDLSSGVEDFFYQPFQGLILGPEEFVEGLALGVSSLVGHAFGGAAGAASRIAGTLGKGVAALTLDDEYQRKRQEQLNRRPQNIGEGLTRGAKGVGLGVYDGVTGVFFKPIEGAREDGITGFARGFGKGIVGAVARPVSGVVDFASGTLDAIKTIATNAEDAKSIRPPRVILKDHIVRPFSYEDSIGCKIFRDTDHGKYLKTDEYICHSFINQKHVFIVTNQRAMFSKQQDLLGSWITQWAHCYTDIEKPKLVKSKTPETDGKVIELRLKEKSRGFFGLGSGSSGNTVVLKNSAAANFILEKLQTAWDEKLN